MFWVWWERAADEPPEPVATTFAPDVSIGVPDDSAHVGSRFRVSFSRVAGSDAGCTASARGLYALASYDHTARVYRVTQDAGVSLVGKPSALSGKCRYTATFPLSPFRPSSSRLQRQRVIDETLDADAPQVSAATTFEPVVTVQVPPGYRSAAFEVEVPTFTPATMRQPKTAIAPADTPQVSAATTLESEVSVVTTFAPATMRQPKTATAPADTPQVSAATTLESEVSVVTTFAPAAMRQPKTAAAPAGAARV